MRMNFQNALAPFAIGKANHGLPIEAPWS
jgi:hypothetical protein